MEEEIAGALFMIVCITCAVCLVLAGPIFIVGVGASHGYHTGYVVAVEQNDNVLWDATLVYFKTDAESTQENVYCVNDRELEADLVLFAQNKQLVTIEYSNPFWFFRFQCNGGESIIVNAKMAR